MSSSNGQPQPQQPDDVAPRVDAVEQPVEASTSPRANITKVVSIAQPESESISPRMNPKHKEIDHNDHLDLDKTAKQFRASVSGKRLSGRPSMERSGSTPKAQSTEGNPSLTSLVSESSEIAPPRHTHDNLLKQVTAWLKNEKARRAARKANRKTASAKDSATPTDSAVDTVGNSQASSPRERRLSESSEGSVALEQLAHILERTLSLKSTEGSPRHRKYSHGRKLSAVMKRSSAVSSGEDYFESIDQLVPSCDAVLDNSKTLAYGAGGPESGADSDCSGKIASRRARKEKEAWATFKFEIVRLTHTLKLKGWRRVPLDQSGEIDVQRLSGAMTNAIYVVSPPKHLPPQEAREDGLPVPKNQPPKLLLRIYGPQVEHLIDRDSELQILRRLARKRIGPRLLGTFTNGRFEEFFHAKALTFQELRIPDTSKQIAKRMRELHEGIDLLQNEREAGPFVWRNWDKWVDRVEQIVTWLDQQVVEGEQSAMQPALDGSKERGFICGVKWPVFRKMIEKYRAWLEEQYGGKDKVNERLVFAHNDTQYGNILRMTPSGESPLLLPANEHKQLIVIDFEYANANLPGLEFANHFTEWCYNYHDPEFPFRCNTAYYPTPEEQRRFIRAYLMHNPTFRAPGGSSSNPPTPSLGPLHTSGSSCALAATATPTTISAFMLDSRAPPGEKYSYQEQEAQDERRIEEEVRRLMAETRLWRLANSAQWVAWGIVQAQVPGLPDFGKDGEAALGNEAAEMESATLEVRAEAGAEAKQQNDVSEKEGPEIVAQGETDQDADHDDTKDEEEEFDYLGYSHERAMFLWGDAIRLGIVKADELPEEVRERVKTVEY